MVAMRTGRGHTSGEKRVCQTGRFMALQDLKARSLSELLAPRFCALGLEADQSRQLSELSDDALVWRCSAELSDRRRTVVGSRTPGNCPDRCPYSLQRRRPMVRLATRAVTFEEEG
jgi:hypothetical protein